MIINSKTIFDSDDDEEYDEEDEAGLFFKDFSPDAPRLSTVLNKKKRASRKASSKKATTRMSKFDLMSFANHLHDNRLSVMQLRESRIALTEEDEQELIKLLEKRKSMANSVHQMPLPSDESIPAVPPLPDNADKEHEEEEDAPVESSTSTTQEENKAQNAAAADDDDDLRKDGDEQPAEKKEEEKENDTASSLDTTPKAPLEEPAASLLIEKEASRKRRVRKSMSMDEIHRMQQAQEEKTLVEMEPIQEVEPSLSSSSTHKSRNNNNKSDSKVAPPNITIKPSTSTPSIKSRHSESPKPSPRNKAIGLFGSLRQASRATPLRGLVRNLSTNASRLSRQASFTRSSTSNTYNNKFASSSRATLATQNGEDLSPAARAVMQHNDKQQRKKDNKKNNDEEHEQQQQPQEESTKKSRLLTHLLAKAGKARRTKTVNMASSSSTSTANKRRDKTKSKIVRRTIIYVPPDSLNFMKNLEKGDIDTSKTPATTAASGQDDLSAMPPLPSDMMKRIQQYNEEDGGNPSEEQQQHHDELDSVLNYYDDESLYDYYRNRESSVPQLEGLELREMDDGTVEWGIVKKQGNRKSFFAAHGMNVSYSPEQNGTTTPTKSDVAHEMMEEEDDEEDEEKIEEHVLRLMGLPVPTPSPKDAQLNNMHSSTSTTSPPPVPRRSPRRRMESSSSSKQQHEDDEQDHRRAKHISTIHSRKDASTTDVYFAPQQTLPSLLQMIANTSGGDDGEHEQEKKHASVEEQLDEVMRSFQPPTSVH